MRTILILCATLVVVTSKVSPLRSILSSPTQTLRLYRDFKTSQHLSYRGPEDALRFRIFRRSAQFVADASEVEGETATFGLNFFSAMTPEERRSYLGLNVTGRARHSAPLSTTPLTKPPASKLWVTEGKVTEVKNQGACGSCWTFGAVGGIETAYASTAGVVRNFAEQEFLDCVYEWDDTRDGCNGGWPDEAYGYSIDAGGRLAATKDYSYGAVDVDCKKDTTPNAMIGAVITDFISVDGSEKANIAAMAKGALSVAFEVTDKFQAYTGGILKDETCTGWPNHAVTAVGYTPKYILVKNSWGSAWGDKGFVKFTRNYHNCELYNWSSRPVLTVTETMDPNPADPATTYNPEEGGDDGDDDKECADKWEFCEDFLDLCNLDFFVRDFCRKSCDKCDDVIPTDDGGDDECPSGTVRCPDGVCRHEHMC